MEEKMKEEVTANEKPAGENKIDYLDKKVYKFLHIVWDIADGFGLHISNRLEVEDIKSGRKWS